MIRGSGGRGWELELAQASTVVGGRHALREALAQGGVEAARAALGALERRGWGEQALSSGAWETLRSALQGPRPEESLAFLREQGLAASFEMATEALAAALARPDHARWQRAIEELVRGFEAGARDDGSEAWRRLAGMGQGLAEQAAARWERWELGRSAGPGKPERVGGGWL